MANYNIQVLKNPDTSNRFFSAEIWYSEQVLTEDEIFLHADSNFPILHPNDTDDIPEDLVGNHNVWKYTNPDPRDGLVRTVNYFVLRDEHRNLYGYCRMVPPLNLNRAYITYLAVNVHEGTAMLDIVFDKVQSYESHYTNREVLQHKWFGRQHIEFPWSGKWYLGSCYAMLNFKEPSLIENAANAFGLIGTAKATDIHFAESNEDRAIVPSQNNVILEDGVPLSSHVYFRLTPTILQELNLSVFDLHPTTDISLGILLFAIKDHCIYVFGSGTNLWSHKYYIDESIDLSYTYYSKIYFWREQLIVVLDHRVLIVQGGDLTYQSIGYNMVPACYIHHRNVSVTQLSEDIIVPENFDLTEMLCRVSDSSITQYTGINPRDADWKDLLNTEEVINELGGNFDYNGSEINSMWSFLESASQVKAIRHTKKELMTFILDSGVVSIDPTDKFCRFYTNNLRAPLSEGIVSFELSDNSFFNGDINGINLVTESKMYSCTPNSTTSYNYSDIRGIRGFKFSILNNTVF